MVEFYTRRCGLLLSVRGRPLLGQTRGPLYLLCKTAPKKDPDLSASLSGRGRAPRDIATLRICVFGDFDFGDFGVSFAATVAGRYIFILDDLYWKPVKRNKRGRGKSDHPKIQT